MASLLSSPRSLSSATLLSSAVQYSPIESEILWRLQDPIERAHHTDALLTLRGWITNLYHEQNHRVLWTCLPPPPKSPSALRRYLNFAEALVVMLDTALGDELGPRISQVLHLWGVVYDPGTETCKKLSNSRKYRNYLQSTLLATYLLLEGYEPKQIHPIVKFHLGAGTHPAAITRALRLDKKFVEYTNPVWQSRHLRTVGKSLARKGHTLTIGDSVQDPTSFTEIYRIGEATMNLFSI